LCYHFFTCCELAYYSLPIRLCAWIPWTASSNASPTTTPRTATPSSASTRAATRTRHRRRHAAGNHPGESLRLQGQWITNAQYGKQFKAEKCEQVLPATIEGLKKYLGSGLIKGVGPVTAQRIVKRFGLETLDVLDHSPERIREVLGIGPKRAAAIARAWDEQKSIKQVMLFLQGHGVNTGLAVKIYKQYGDAAIDLVQADPYRLAQDIYGIGFKTADKIAHDLGLPHDAPSRVAAGVVYTLSNFTDQGTSSRPISVDS
jgi:exodeoxyribonuclease V alpha subunit